MRTLCALRRFDFSTVQRWVSLLDDVLRENRSGASPGTEAALDQSAAAFEPGFLFNEGAHFGFAFAHRLRKRAMPEPMGMLEPGHGHQDDCGRSMHARLRLLRGDNSETIRAGGRRAATRRRGSASNEIKTRRDYCGCTR